MVAPWQSTGEYGKRARSENAAIRRHWLSGLALMLMLLLTGCASVRQHSLTCKLWTEADFRSFNQPAPRPNLALYETTNRTEVLVQYDAVSEGSADVTRKTYLLQLGHAGIVTRQKPSFANASMAEGLKPIPIFPAEPAPTNVLVRPVPHAVAAPDSPNFTFYQDSRSGQAIGLPIYVEHSGTAARVALTPLAVGGDAIVVAAVAAVVVVIALCWGNESFTVH